jgi:CBS domain-containing protein
MLGARDRRNFQGMIGTPVPPFERAIVGDLMRPGILSCHADAELTEVADTMATHRVHAVVVRGMPAPAARDDAEASGLISDVDLVRAVADERHRTAGGIARTDGITIDPQTPLVEATRVMAESGTAHLIVVRDGEPVGMVSGLDIAAAIAWGGGA